VIGTPHDVHQWSMALDAYEASLDAHRAMLADLAHSDEVPVPAPFVPPALAGPMPVSLEARAKLLLDETAALLRLAKDLSLAASPLASTARRFPSSGGATVLDRVL
jgi:hypothetical protein